MPFATELPKVRPISDLRTHLQEIEEIAKETCEPILLTRNGASTLVLMDSDAFDEHLRHERAVRKLREAEIEAKYADKTYSHGEVKTRMQELLAEVRSANA